MMERRTIYITEFDMERLHKLVDDARRMDRNASQHLEGLAAELSRAQVVAPADVPADVVTMNSKVRLRDLDADEEMIITLVFPGDANIAQSKISILAPIGTAMLGYRIGDVFTWEVPDGVRRLQIEEVIFQPEASGNYDL